MTYAGNQLVFDDDAGFCSSNFAALHRGAVAV
jgi:hypothetical protein